MVNFGNHILDVTRGAGMIPSHDGIGRRHCRVA
jgi:hypothetical protein